jgi:multidrug resistance efflux pump
LRAPREGYLQRVTAAHEQVAEGTILARLRDPEVEAAFEDVRSRIDVLDARITDGRERLALHLSMREQVRETLGRLYSDAAMARFDAGISLRPSDYNDQRSRLEQDLRGFEIDLARAVSEMRALRQQRTSMQIASPTGGLVAEWLAEDGQYMRVGETLAIYETHAPRVIRGWLDDRVSGSVRPGMQAEIRLPGRDPETRIPGRVTTVEAGANPAEPDRFGLVVTIETVGLDADETRARLRFNAPTEVIVKRGLLAHWFGTGG